MSNASSPPPVGAAGASAGIDGIDGSGGTEPSLVIARAPLRISFAGGGTDLPAYYERHGGLVLSAAITRSVYAVLAAGDYERLHIAASNYRTVYLDDPAAATRDERLALPRAVAAAMGLERGASVLLTAEAPAGTGLGSSSTQAAALIAAIAAFQGRAYGPRAIAELAARVEIEGLGQPIGKQDQYAAAYGGINVFAFGAGGVAVTPLTLAAGVRRGLEERLLLYFTGSTRQAGSILREQRARTAAGEAGTLAALHALKESVGPMRAALEGGDYAGMGALLDAAWGLKRRVSSGISTGAIDGAYEAARGAGAWGGKITGAGGGGFLLLLAPPEARGEIHAALSARGLRRMPFGLEGRGAHTLVVERHGATLEGDPQSPPDPDPDSALVPGVGRAGGPQGPAGAEGDGPVGDGAAD